MVLEVIEPSMVELSRLLSYLALVSFITHSRDESAHDTASIRSAGACDGCASGPHCIREPAVRLRRCGCHSLVSVLCEP